MLFRAASSLNYSLHPKQGPPSPYPTQPSGSSVPRKSDKGKGPPHTCSLGRASWRGEDGKGGNQGDLNFSVSGGKVGGQDCFTAEISQFSPSLQLKLLLVPSTHQSCFCPLGPPRAKSRFFLKCGDSVGTPQPFPPDGSVFRLFTTHLQFVEVRLKVQSLGVDTRFSHRGDYHLP